MLILVGLGLRKSMFGPFETLATPRKQGFGVIFSSLHDLLVFHVRTTDEPVDVISFCILKQSQFLVLNNV